jgi:propionyl-CoA synthetase
MLKTIFDVKPGHVVFSSSDIGWIVGHNFIVYAPLLKGATSVVYEGKPVGTPDAGVMWRMIQDYKVNTFYIAPTAVRAIKKEDIHGELIKKYDTSSLTGIHLAGERCDPGTLNWIQ